MSDDLKKNSKENQILLKLIKQRSTFCHTFISPIQLFNMLKLSCNVLSYEFII